MLAAGVQIYISCNESAKEHLNKSNPSVTNNDFFAVIDTSKIPAGKYGEAIRYGRELMLHTAYYIGPNGVNGKYLGNKMNCSNCHQEAGTKPYSFYYRI